jgi:hypothetical protein
MAFFPDSRFIQEFARRTRTNILNTELDHPITNKDTALIGSLLAVFVLPHERGDADKFMAEILRDYREDINEVIEVVRLLNHKQGGPDEAALPDRLEKVPAYLRHAISHFNIKPESRGGQNLTHLLVWNRVPDLKRYGKDRGKIAFIARIHLERLRALALHILDRLSKSTTADRYEAIDPIAEFDEQGMAGEETGVDASIKRLDVSQDRATRSRPQD